MSQPAEQFTEPPIGPDGFIDIPAIATRIPGGPEVVPSGIDLAALDAATPAGPTGPFGRTAAAPPLGAEAALAEARAKAAEQARRNALSIAQAEQAVATARRAAAEPEQPVTTGRDLLIAEVAAETPKPDLPDGACTVDLKDRFGETVVATFVILHADDWPSSANAAVNDPMLWFQWALKVFASDEDRELWRALDPTNRQVRRFIDAWQIASGNIEAPKGQR